MLSICLPHFKEKKIPACEIDFDEIVKKDIYENINSEGYSSYKEKNNSFIFLLRKKKVMISQEMISQLVFQGNVRKNLTFLQKTLKPLIYRLYRKKITNRNGIVFFECSTSSRI